MSDADTMLELEGVLDGYIQAITDPAIRVMVGYAIGQALPMFPLVPGASHYHHAYVHGLLQHTVEVVRAADGITRAFPDDAVDRDIVIAGAILHDIGKAFCFEYDEMTDLYVKNWQDHLVDHKTVGYKHLGDCVAALSMVEIPERTVRALQHIIMSHHGEFGDVKPKTPEAVIVHFADNISASLRPMFADLDTMVPGTYVHRGAISNRPAYKL